ncbi:MAG TPA: HAD family hydrolase [Pseudonocardiaceae bacterium]|nr:HAD family hydrolase [Pseudonocardiaceae bacterium]
MTKDSEWRPRLVASDIDGTLLPPVGGPTGPTRAMVAAVLAADVPFVLVTGRPPRWVGEVAEAVGVSGYAVCSNGAVLYDIGADRVLDRHLFDPETLMSITHSLQLAVPGFALAVERVGDSAFGLAGAEFETEQGYVHPWPDDPGTGLPRAKLIGRPAVKLLVRHLNMTSAELAASVGELVDEQTAAITYSTNDGMIELSPPKVTKGSGLAQVAEWLGIAAADVIAFGDMPNDLPMLRWAGYSVAVANAHSDIVAVADEVTGSNAEDGVAQVLARWFAG